MEVWLICEEEKKSELRDEKSKLPCFLFNGRKKKNFVRCKLRIPRKKKSEFLNINVYN